MHTLVLNQSYMPINCVPAVRALKWVLSGRVEVVEEYEGVEVFSAALEAFAVPSIVRFSHRIVGMFRRGVKFNRKNVWLRDKQKCQYCGHRVALDDFEFEHVIPKSQGGKTRWENIVVACTGCNQRKRNRTPEQAGMRLLQRPVRPKHLPGTFIPKRGLDLATAPESWQDYVGSYLYWNTKLTE